MSGAGQPDQPRGLDVVLVALDQRRAAHGAGVLHPERQPDGHDENAEGGAARGCAPFSERVHDAVDEQRDQDGREGQLHVGDAHDDGVDASAGIAGQQAERDAERSPRAPRRERRSAGKRAGRRGWPKEVAALVVGAEQKARIAALHPARRDIGVDAGSRCAGSNGFVRRDQRRQQRRRRSAGATISGRDHRHRRARKLATDVAVGRRAARAAGAASAAAAAALMRHGVGHGQAPPRLTRSRGSTHAVEQVDHQVDGHEQKRDQHQVGRHDRDVDVLHRLEEQQRPCPATGTPSR